jgi:signal peptidase I
MLLKRLGAFFLDILEIVVFSIAIFLFVYLLIMQPHKIKGSSMEPNFQDKEFILTDKITYRFKEPQRGDVVVFEAPYASGDEYIKRIIGLPGVYVNDQKLDEGYIPDYLPTNGNIYLKSGQEVVVPSGYYFVLGDNRVASSDSRAWGFVKKDKIKGKAFFIYWPPKDLGLIQKMVYGVN